MLVYARFIAWVSSVPKGSKVSRIDIIQAQGDEPRFPEPTATYLAEILLDLGPAVSSGMGLTAVTYTDIVNWMTATGVALSPWECQTLKAMSKAYANQAAISSDKNCPSPWLEKLPTRDAVAQGTMAALRSIRKKKG